MFLDYLCIIQVFKIDQKFKINLKTFEKSLKIFVKLYNIRNDVNYTR